MVVFELLQLLSMTSHHFIAHNLEIDSEKVGQIWWKQEQFDLVAVSLIQKLNHYLHIGRHEYLSMSLPQHSLQEFHANSFLVIEYPISSDAFDVDSKSLIVEILNILTHDLFEVVFVNIRTPGGTNFDDFFIIKSRNDQCLLIYHLNSLKRLIVQVQREVCKINQIFEDILDDEEL